MKEKKIITREMVVVATAQELRGFICGANDISVVAMVVDVIISGNRENFKVLLHDIISVEISSHLSIIPILKVDEKDKNQKMIDDLRSLQVHVSAAVAGVFPKGMALDASVRTPSEKVNPSSYRS